MKLFPFTYINANLSSDRGITAAKLVEMVSSFAHAQGVTRVDLSDNPISGSKYEDDSDSDDIYNPYADDGIDWNFNGGIEEYDTDVSGIEALSGIKVKSLIMRNCELGPKAITALSSNLSKVAVVDILANPIGEDGFKMLIELFESTPRIQSMCGVQHGTKAADFSKRGLKPIDIKIIAHELSSNRSMAGVVEVDVSGNTNIGDPIESSEPVDVKIEELFSAFDVGGIGRLGQEQYKAFLTAIGMWGSGNYTDDKWDSEWPEECVTLGGTAEEGIDRESFTLLYTKYLSSQLSAHHAEVCSKFPHLVALCESKLKVLRLANCGLGPKSIEIVAATLATAGVETVDLSYNRFDPSLLDGIKDKVELNLTGCRK